MRDTKQRTAIFGALRKAGQPLTPKQIRELAARDVPNLGIATVYRNLRLMMENEEIEALEVPGHRTCYTTPRSKQMAVLVCRQTNRVHLADGMKITFNPEHLPSDFHPEDVEIYIYGHFGENGNGA